MTDHAGAASGAGGGGETTFAAKLISRAGRRLLVVSAYPTPSAALADEDWTHLSGRPWHPGTARARARMLRDCRMAGREVVLLGRRVARAFARLDPALAALAAAPVFSMAAPTVPAPGGGWARTMVWLAPPRGTHESGLFWQYIAGRLEFRFEADLPAPTELARTALDLLAEELGTG